MSRAQDTGHMAQVKTKDGSGEMSESERRKHIYFNKRLAIHNRIT